MLLDFPVCHTCCSSRYSPCRFPPRVAAAQDAAPGYVHRQWTARAAAERLWAGLRESGLVELHAGAARRGRVGESARAHDVMVLAANGVFVDGGPRAPAEVLETNPAVEASRTVRLSWSR